MDGVASSNYITLEEHGLRLDAAASQRFKYMVRIPSCCLTSRERHIQPAAAVQMPHP